MNEVFERKSGNDTLTVSYYPGMVEISILDGWHDLSTTFNVCMADWRAMNVAVEKSHNGGVE